MPVLHNIPPVFDGECTVLILGSFPSVKSRETAFFYGHPQNRFWRVLAGVFSEPVPQTTAEKTRFLLSHHIALWDVIASCDISGSADAAIKNAVPNDVGLILQNANIQKIFVNGQTAKRYYDRFLLPVLHVPAVCLPSTSPANARMDLNRLISAWRAALDPQPE